ncbi:dihydrofolate reductase family protein [Dactylosporangium sp. CS-033363]|uniref:dihydrofolate reductase family protein n=1 Tax=Dactylosporangium sp. CS-033363 TaxID=3239935 RepID=UPI003D8B64C2
MGNVVVDMAASLDGYVTGLNQRLEAPFGDGEVEKDLHSWMFDTAEENTAELEAITDAGSFIMGRNMFSPDRGAWDLDWRGWWGPNPPYHGPVFVLTHHERAPLEMEGGTTFHFVTNGLAEAMKLAREAAGERNISVCGGAQTVNQCLAAGLIDELRLHVAPVLLGRGGRLFEGIGRIGLEQVGVRQATRVTHLRYLVQRD